MWARGSASTPAVRRGGHVLEGDAEMTIAGTVVRVGAGELVLLPANQPHAILARARFKMLLTMIRSM